MHNISDDFFTYHEHIPDRLGRPLANVYWTLNNADTSRGTVYLIHGYGGSPVEPIMQIPAQIAYNAGFNIAAIEGCDLSATSGLPKDINTMRLGRHTVALRRGIEFFRTIPELSAHYNIAWAHSISCRALSDLVVNSTDVRRFWRVAVLNNPYFIPPTKVTDRHIAILARDPSGRMWEHLMMRVSNIHRRIENYDFSVPACLRNLYIPLPKNWCARPIPQTVGHTMSQYVRDIDVYFILGTVDDMADFAQNVRFFDELDIPNKQIMCINDGNHIFDSVIDDYRAVADKVIQKLAATRMVDNGR